MGRPASPALSENEVDISRSLFSDKSSDRKESDLDSDLDGDPVGLHSIEEASDSDGDEAFIAATQAKANRQNASKTPGKVGGFQSMGLNANLLKTIAKMGFKSPTDIQKTTIPTILDGQDVVGMARTGSGKTAAFVIPMIEKLKSHSAKVGARAFILSPTRELALQTFKVIKGFGKGTDLRAVLLIGGESLEDQFSQMASNPDIIIATPARFEHLKIEMKLDLSSIQYVVFDEADQLFEMNFETTLTEILHSLPSSRQMLLFSATMPTRLVEFSQARLQDPRFERLDVESKISPNLESAFFTVKGPEKEGALLHILQDVVQLPMGSGNFKLDGDGQSAGRKRKRVDPTAASKDAPASKSTIVFAATKYHVEYLVTLLKSFGYATSYVYSTLDQTARTMQLGDFRSGVTNVLVVTDLGARGLDIPTVANVINYDFPPQPKSFVHRVGRTARAGKAGWSYSLVTDKDVAYLLDLQLFLNRKLVLGRNDYSESIFNKGIVVGSMIRQKLDFWIEEVSDILSGDEDLTAMREVAGRGEQQYSRTIKKASAASTKRGKGLARSGDFKDTNLLFESDEHAKREDQTAAMLAKVSGFRPQETVFEIGRKGNTSEAANVMKRRRAKIEPVQRNPSDQEKDHASNQREVDATENGYVSSQIEPTMDVDSDEELVLTGPGNENDMGLEDDSMPESHGGGRRGAQPDRLEKWQDSEHFMGYAPTDFNASDEQGFGVHSGSSSNFVEAARSATFDLNNDQTKAFGEPSRARGLRWDKKSRKYVSRANDDDGSKGRKTMTSESGQKIAASFRSGRFDAWRKANKVDRLPAVGEMERKGQQPGNKGEQRYKHKMVRAPKEADKYRDDYHKRKKRVEEAKEKRIGRFAEGKGKSELKGVDHVRKARKLKDRKREKNARPSRRT